MKQYWIFALVVLVVTVEFGEAQSRCPQNQQWTTCGTACEPTCDTPEIGACTEQCVVGCQCPRGLLKNRQGRCVQMNDC